MDDIISDAEVRRQRSLQRLGEPAPRCGICGECNSDCLEQHHIAGRAYHAQTTATCRNCHRKLSSGQRDHPAQQHNPPAQTEIIGHFLLGLADMLVLVAQTLVQFGRELIALSTQPNNEAVS